MSEPYTWPTELDDAQRLLNVVGGFWADTYAGNDLVASVLYAKAQAQAQAHFDLLELLASISRFKVPVFHTENWTLLPILESKLNANNLPRFNGEFSFNSGIQFGEAQGNVCYSWAVPSNLRIVNVVTNRITNPTVTYTSGADFYLENGAIWFSTNPFENTEIRIEEVFDNAVKVDRIAYLWMYRGQFDLDTVYQQFGYALGIKIKSSQQYKAMVNATFDGIVTGTTAKTIEEFMSAVCDVPLALEKETIRYIFKDTRYTWIITDNNAYKFSPYANPIVKVGDVVSIGDPFTDSLRFYDLNRGVLPDVLKFLAIGRGLLPADYKREIGFENKNVPLVVIETPDDFTRIEFELAGWPADIEKFWDQTHANGVAAGKTLAMLLDTRSNPTTQPTAFNLPLTVNPLLFLANNVFRGNAFIVAVKPVSFGDDALGLTAAKLLTKLIPPQTVCIILVTLEYVDDTVTMDGLGNETIPGYDEDLSIFIGMTIEDTVDPLTLVTEDIKVYQIEGYCT